MNKKYNYYLIYSLNQDYNRKANPNKSERFMFYFSYSIVNSYESYPNYLTAEEIGQILGGN